MAFLASLLIPNCTFLARFGGVSGEFRLAMVCILAIRSRAKIPMTRRASCYQSITERYD